MVTAIVIGFVVIMWLLVNRSTQPIAGTLTARRKRSSWAWAIVGAALGSFVGIAAVGTAIAGTIPGAIVGYFAADYLMIRGANGNFGSSDLQFVKPLISESEFDKASRWIGNGIRLLFQLAVILSILGAIALAAFWELVLKKDGKQTSISSIVA